MAFHNKLGAEGERMACEMLIKKGLTIRETNWRVGKLEIDIVAQDSNNLLHIVEVKTRSSDSQYDPMRSINEAKKRHMVSAAKAYLLHNGVRMGVQYDIVIIVGDHGNFDIRYYPNAFYPRLRTYR